MPGEPEQDVGIVQGGVARFRAGDPFQEGDGVVEPLELLERLRGRPQEVVGGARQIETVEILLPRLVQDQDVLVVLVRCQGALLTREAPGVPFRRLVVVAHRSSSYRCQAVSSSLRSGPNSRRNVSYPAFPCASARA